MSMKYLWLKIRKTIFLLLKWDNTSHSNRNTLLLSCVKEIQNKYSDIFTKSSQNLVKIGKARLFIKLHFCLKQLKLHIKSQKQLKDNNKKN